ncbi:hypothetical protein [Kitasatospora sp. MAP5-34]|uniref:hypothetical protein n=1 Tax=Kitasatospora sp. MAP5-34 TaxID=3035102 RepID=UPI0024739872|nr:hypothetical protein [Kitasatospora sp. MAP5-34]MDH6576253.1 homoserine acetyltransferase [Kitasatospora sp. MAP5-34]
MEAPVAAGCDANDLLAMLWTWQHADIGATPGFQGDLPRALGAIPARTLSLPSRRDLYFPPEDEVWACQYIPDGTVRTIPGIWGHLAGGGVDAEAAAFIGMAVRELLATSPADL